MEEGEDQKKLDENSNRAEFFSCLLQPSSSSGSDPIYVGTRRLLLYRKALSGIDLRQEWRCNGKGYVAYRNYIRRPRNWENSQVPSLPSTPGHRVSATYSLSLLA